MKKKIGVSLIIIGLCLLLFAVGLLVYNNHENHKAQQQANRVLHSLKDKIAPPSTAEDPFDTAMRVVEIDGYGYIGYLSVPQLDLELPVMSEWDYERLRIAPCRYYGSTKTDNLVICAHNYKSHFGYIGNLTADSTVIFTDMDGIKQNYRVTSVETLQPSQTKSVKDTGDDLVLYTCTYSGSMRIVVRCEKVK